MENPFTKTRKVMSGFWQSASSSDCAPGQAKAAVVLFSPVIAPVVFLSAFFTGGKKNG